MSDQQKAHLSLALALHTADAARALLDAPPPTPPAPSAALAVVRADFLSLLALLHASVTKVSLSLNPAKPTYAAARAPLTDTADHLAAIAHCVSLLQPRDGTTLRNEYAAIARDLLSATSSLLHAFLPSIPAAPPSHQYLPKTGAVYALIDSARKPDSLSLHNPAAVRKAWLRDHAILLDALQELEQSLQDTDDDDDDQDNGWDELGLDLNHTISSDERKRAEALLNILRTSTLIHHRVSDGILSSFPADPPPSNEANQRLDSLVSRSAALINATDELVGTVYSSPEELEQELVSFQTIISDIKSDLDHLQTHLPLHQQLQKLQINENHDFKELQQNIDSLLTSIRS